MHRLAAQPGSNDPDQRGQLIEQVPAPVLVLTSADTDLLALAALTKARPQLLGTDLRGLNLAALPGPAQIDHYLSTTVAHAQLVVVRLLGGRGHWSYGLEQLRLWARQARGRQLLVLAGTPDEDLALSTLGTVEPALAQALARCWRAGGEDNLALVLETLARILTGAAVPLPEAVPQADPLPHDWRDEPGPRVGVLLYRALLQANDTAWMEALLAALRRRGLVPRALWVSGLRDGVVAQGVGRLLAREQVEAVICGTAFASVQFDEAGLGAPLWDELGVPVLQLLASSQSRASWQASSIGLSPLDLSLQVALPELDGRLTTRIGAFKESVAASHAAGPAAAIGSVLHQVRPDPERLDWVVQLCRNWITLRRTPAAERRIALVLANYPTRNSRLANGVGLDTPASTALMLQWLNEAGYTMPAPPDSGQALIEALLGGRSNDPESAHLAPMDQLPLRTYQQWYVTLPEAARSTLERHWGLPQADPSLEADPAGDPCFPIRGLRLGHVAVLIQPARGYDRDPAATFHSPDLPPTHAYLAQYLWLREVAGVQLFSLQQGPRAEAPKHGAAAAKDRDGPLGLHRTVGPPLPRPVLAVTGDAAQEADELRVRACGRQRQARRFEELVQRLARHGQLRARPPGHHAAQLLQEDWRARIEVACARRAVPFVSVVAEEEPKRHPRRVGLRREGLAELLVGRSRQRVEPRVERRERRTVAQRARDGNLAARAPHLRRAEEALGELRVAVEVEEERAVRAFAEEVRQHAVDHRVEDQVVERRDARVEPRVPEHHVVQFVHDEHHQLLRGLRVPSHELRVDEEPRADGALDAGGGDVGGLDDLRQLEQARQAVRARGKRREDAVGDRGGGVGHRGSFHERGTRRSSVARICGVERLGARSRRKTCPEQRARTASTSRGSSVKPAIDSPRQVGSAAATAGSHASFGHGSAA